MDYSRAINLDPDSIEAYIGRGVAHARTEQYMQAIRDYTQALTRNPKLTNIYAYRGIAYGLIEKYPEAIRDCTSSVNNDPDLATGHLCLCLVYVGSEAYLQAVTACNLALTLDISPLDMDTVYYALGKSHAELQEYEQALAVLSQGLANAPQNIDLYTQRGSVYWVTHNYAEAIADLNEVLAREPNDIQASNNLAWILATCPEAKYRDGDKAVELAKKAVTQGLKGEGIETLAAAYAEVGNFEEAISTQETAVALLEERPSGNESQLQKAKERLALYRNHQTFIDTQ
jgi:tetratricopeptide (TPR) repeat protein